MFLTVTDPAKREELFKEYQKIKKDIRDETEQKKIASLERLRQNIDTFAPLIHAQKVSTDRIEKTLEPLEEQLSNIKQESKIPENIRDKTLREEKGETYFGQKEISVTPTEINVDDKTFHKSQGLWALITLKDPGGFNHSDAQNYKEFLKKTGWLYTKNGSFKSLTNKGNIPKKQLQIEAIDEIKSQSGSAIFLPSDKNALRRRLHLLCSEYVAGNTNTREEIINILDELKRQNIIGEQEFQEINQKIYTYYDS